jgi:hypothetical protein
MVVFISFLRLLEPEGRAPAPAEAILPEKIAIDPHWKI